MHINFYISGLFNYLGFLKRIDIKFYIYDLIEYMTNGNLKNSLIVHNFLI